MLRGLVRPKSTRLDYLHGTPSRRFHLKRTAAVDLLRSNLPDRFRVHDGESSAQSQDEAEYVEIRIHASRATHSPAIRLITHGETTIFPVSFEDTSLSEGKEGSSGQATSHLDGLLKGLWDVWRQNDLTRLDVKATWGPEGPITLSDVSVQVDDFAAYRQPTLKDSEDTSILHPLEVQARKAGLFYHKVEGGGNIGCYGYGAGVAMSTMDALVAAGGAPANFLDGGGGATDQNVQAAMEVVLSDPDVQVIFINSFGGLTKTGVVDHLRKRKEAGKGYPPMFIRLRGTEEKEARKTLEEAEDLEGIHLFDDMKEAAAAAVEAAGKMKGRPPSPVASESTGLAFTSQIPAPSVGPYESTMRNIMAPENAKVLIMGTGKASQFHNKVAQNYGTNIVAAVAPGKGGQEFLGKPVYGNIQEAVEACSPYAVAVFVPPRAAADAIIECIDSEIPLIVSFAEGIPTHDQLRVQARLRDQSKSRLIGANCPGMIIPSLKLKLGIQPLHVHSTGCIGLASRSGTISYELAALTTELGFGQSIVFGLGGDPFPGTRTWEALRLMLDDPKTELICLVGEIGGQMEEEAAAVYRDYKSNLPSDKKPKPVVGFIAGQSTERGKMYGHAGAIWYEINEKAEAKRRCWEEAGFVVARTLGDVGGLIQREMEKVDRR